MNFGAAGVAKTLVFALQSRVLGNKIVTEANSYITIFTVALGTCWSFRNLNLPSLSQLNRKTDFSGVRIGGNRKFIYISLVVTRRFQCLKEFVQFYVDSHVYGMRQVSAICDFQSIEERAHD